MCLGLIIKSNPAKHYNCKQKAIYSQTIIYGQSNHVHIQPGVFIFNSHNIINVSLLIFFTLFAWIVHPFSINNILVIVNTWEIDSIRTKDLFFSLNKTKVVKGSPQKKTWIFYDILQKGG